MVAILIFHLMDHHSYTVIYILSFGGLWFSFFIIWKNLSFPCFFKFLFYFLVDGLFGICLVRFVFLPKFVENLKNENSYDVEAIVREIWKVCENHTTCCPKVCYWYWIGRIVPRWLSQHEIISHVDRAFGCTGIVQSDDLDRWCVISITESGSA